MKGLNKNSKKTVMKYIPFNNDDLQKRGIYVTCPNCHSYEIIKQKKAWSCIDCYNRFKIPDVTHLS